MNGDGSREALPQRPGWRAGVFRRRDKATLSELIVMENPSPARDRYLRVSWLSELVRARSRARRNRLGFKISRLVAVGGALMLPVFASLNVASQTEPWVPRVTLVVSILVALATAFMQVFRFGNEWRMDENYAFALEAEGWAYLEHAGGYRNATYPDVFEDFFDAVESLRKTRALQRSKEIMEMAAQAARDLGDGTKTEGRNGGAEGPKEPEVGFDRR
jgi:hypothetical protein